MASIRFKVCYGCAMALHASMRLRFKISGFADADSRQDPWAARSNLKAGS